MDCYRMLKFVITHLTISVVVSLYSEEGRISTLSTEENLELDRKLSILKKPAVKTIKTEYGDIYDCVDIYKQPALDHPLLKGHKIQMKPSFGLRSSSARNGPSSAGIPMKFGLKDECPTGTIPIRRTTKAELLRAKASFREHFQDPASGLEQGVNGTTHGCYNTFCPGFVLINSKIPLDLVFANVSVAGGSQFYVKLNVFQKTTGVWSLTLSQNDNKNDDEMIGYWPNTLFTNFKNDAGVLRWGGMVYTDKPSSPPMGGGGKDCHYRRLSIIDEAWSWLNDPSTPKLETSESRCYKVGDNSHKDDFWGYSFWFGGKGGDSRHCYRC